MTQMNWFTAAPLSSAIYTMVRRRCDIFA